MEVIKTIKLDSNEKMIIQKALGIIDKIGDESNKRMDCVFAYFINQADIVDDYTWQINSTIQIDEI